MGCTEDKAWSKHFVTSPEFVYATAALSDPKSPFEFRALGPSLWFVQAVVAASVLYMWDPVHLRSDAGWDEAYSSVYSPITPYWEEEKKSFSEFTDESTSGEFWSFIWDF